MFFNISHVNTLAVSFFQVMLTTINNGMFKKLWALKKIITIILNFFNPRPKSHS